MYSDKNKILFLNVRARLGASGRWRAETINDGRACALRFTLFPVPVGYLDGSLMSKEGGTVDKDDSARSRSVWFSPYRLVLVIFSCIVFQITCMVTPTGREETHGIIIVQE